MQGFQRLGAENLCPNLTFLFPLLPSRHTVPSSLTDTGQFQLICGLSLAFPTLKPLMTLVYSGLGPSLLEEGRSEGPQKADVKCQLAPKCLLSSKHFLAVHESSSVYTLAAGGFNLIEPVKDGFLPCWLNWSPRKWSQRSLL